MKQDIRDIFFDNIRKKFLKNKKYYILTNDADVYSLQKIKKNKRFIDAGVAEQNLVNIASGIARSGCSPIIYGFCTFLVFRCYEQLRINIASYKLNCKVVGIGPGFSFSYDGPTHHGTQDAFMMYLIPEFEVINIADNNLANVISKNIEKFKGPTYFRLDKGILNHNGKIKYNLDKGFEFTYKKNKNKTLVISSGYTNKLANEYALENESFDVLNLFRLKNFNKKKFIKNIKSYKKIVVYDESSNFGGISPIINDIILKSNIKVAVKHVNSLDKQIFRYALNRYHFLNFSGISKSNFLKTLK